jgi:hypothetical protein
MVETWGSGRSNFWNIWQWYTETRCPGGDCKKQENSVSTQLTAWLTFSTKPVTSAKRYVYVIRFVLFFRSFVHSFFLSTNPLVIGFQTWLVKKAECCAYNSPFGSPRISVVFASSTLGKNNGMLNDCKTIKEYAVLSLVILSVRYNFLWGSCKLLLQPHCT